MARFRSIAVFSDYVVFERYRSDHLLSRRQYCPHIRWRMALESVVAVGQALHGWHVRPFQGGSVGWVVEVRDE